MVQPQPEVHVCLARLGVAAERVGDPPVLVVVDADDADGPAQFREVGGARRGQTPIPVTPRRGQGSGRGPEV